MTSDQVRRLGGISFITTGTTIREEEEERINIDEESMSEECFVHLPRGIDMTCAICFCVPPPTTAQEHTPCGRLFCGKCLEMWILSRQQDHHHEQQEQEQQETNSSIICPVCKKSLEMTCRKISTENLGVFRILRGLEIKCPFRGDGDDGDGDEDDDGCKKTCEWGDLSKHLEKCEFAVIRCPNVPCKEKVQRRKIREHDSVCPFKLRECSFCGDLIPKPEMDEHMRIGCRSCPGTLVGCSVHGCGARIRRDEMRKHIRSDVETHILILGEQVSRLERLVTTLSVFEFETRIRLNGDEESSTSFFAVGIEWRIEIKSVCELNGPLQVFLCNPTRIQCCVTFSVSVCPWSLSPSLSLSSSSSSSSSAPSTSSSSSPFAASRRGSSSSSTTTTLISPMKSSMRVNTIAKQKFPEDGFWAWGWGNFCQSNEVGNDLIVRISIDRHF